MREKTISYDFNTRIEMIQALLPVGLKAVAEHLEEEVTQLTGEGSIRPRAGGQVRR